MDKTKLLLFSVIGLFLLNVGTIGFLFINRPQFENFNQRKNAGTPKDIIIRKLHFDSNQIGIYEKLIAIHRNKIDSLDNQIKVVKGELYSQLKQTTINNKTKDSLINLLASYEKQINETHFSHFQEIRNICTKAQLNDFNLLTEDLVQLFSSHNKPIPHENHSRPPRGEKHLNRSFDDNRPRPARHQEHAPPPFDENHPRPPRDGNPPPGDFDENHPRPPRDGNPPPRDFDENHPRPPRDGNHPPPPRRENNE